MFLTACAEQPARLLASWSAHGWPGLGLLGRRCGSAWVSLSKRRAGPPSCSYEGGFSRDSPVVRWLWELVTGGMSDEEQRAFLKFFSGSDRSPLGGLGSLRPVIQRQGPDCARLPTAHTCFNTVGGCERCAELWTLSLRARMVLRVEACKNHITCFNTVGRAGVRRVGGGASAQHWGLSSTPAQAAQRPCLGDPHE
jgi:hypothetical protein